MLRKSNDDGRGTEPNMIIRLMTKIVKVASAQLCSPDKALEAEGELHGIISIDMIMESLPNR